MSELSQLCEENKQCRKQQNNCWHSDCKTNIQDVFLKTKKNDV